MTMSQRRIHNSVFIGKGVELGDDVAIGPHAVLLGPLSVGDRAWIGAGAVLGAPPEISGSPQNTAWAGHLAHSGVLIGADVVIRENVVVHQGSYRATTVGDRTWLLNSCYLAHDVLVGADATISAGVAVGGHSQIGDRVNLGMNATVHQGRIVGPASMVGMATPVTRDVPPFAKVYGAPPRLRGVNVVGLSRLGIPSDVAGALHAAFEAGDTLLADAKGLEPIAAYLEWWRAAAPTKPVRTAMGNNEL